VKTVNHIAKHYREVHFGGNWTTTNLKELLSDVTWEEATAKVANFNTIAALLYHIQYFTEAIIPVLQGQPLTAHDKFSYDVSAIESESDWNSMKQGVWERAEVLADLIETVPERTLWEFFSEPKYGNHYRNFHGIIEHTHYHMGQIALLKKHLKERPKNILSLMNPPIELNPLPNGSFEQRRT